MRNPNTLPKRIGKFDIVRPLGAGAQSVVYLAYDAHLQREVAIKSLHLTGRDETRKRMLMDEARTVSKLRHPNIVPIFEAGEQDGDPYLVFEYVEGQTLGNLLRAQGGLTPARAVEILAAILEAVEDAHHHGIIHRDLKPSNILMTLDGVPRVMDFGIAVRVSERADDSDAGVVGTPAYLAPECIKGGNASVQSDVFALGLLLCETITGKPVVGGRDIYAVLDRISREPIRLPPEADGLIDERLGEIILRATAMDSAERYASARDMREALEAWLVPAEPVEAHAPEAGKQGTLEFLLRRMRHKSDFPALSDSISTINRLALSEQESAATLSNNILKDVALTNKLLRLVNSAYYGQSCGTISTVSRAVIILGFSAVRTIATSLVLMEHMQNKAHAAQIKEEFVRAMMGGILARDIARRGVVKDCEEAFICSMFRNLGRMLACYYFPDEIAEIRKLMITNEMTEGKASAKLLGISFEELGIGVARTWGFPDSMVSSMRRLPPGSVRRPNNNSERLRLLTALSDDLCAVFENAPVEARQAEIQKIQQRFGDSVPLDERQLRVAMERSIEEVVTFAAAARVNLQQSGLGRKIGAWVGAQADAAAATTPPVAAGPVRAGAPKADSATRDADCASRDGATDSATGATNEERIAAELFETVTMVVAPQAEQPLVEPAAAEATVAQRSAGPSEAEAQAILNSGIQDITRTLVDDFALSDILRIILETMYRGIGFQRVLLCIRDPGKNAMVAKFGFGAGIENILRHFRFQLGASRDIFDVALSRGADILISDVSDPKIRAHIPDWFSRHIAAETFIVFPLVIKNVPVGLIYADKAMAGELVVPENILSTLRALRNQAVLAIKQSR